VSDLYGAARGLRGMSDVYRARTIQRDKIEEDGVGDIAYSVY
jgi:hypothetical protein